MTPSPKEKAKELVDKFYNAQIEYLNKVGITEIEEVEIKIAIQCAIIAVNEILHNFGLTANGQTFYTEYRAVQHYQEVKEELEKL
jgi:hypothetical protein